MAWTSPDPGGLILSFFLFLSCLIQLKSLGEELTGEVVGMREKYPLPASAVEFYRKRILPEEARRHLVPSPMWNSSFRWFISSNVVDFWDYRSLGERQRIAVYMRNWQFGDNYLVDDMRRKAE
jgi:hypothetical protein